MWGHPTCKYPFYNSSPSLSLCLSPVSAPHTEPGNNRITITTHLLPLSAQYTTPFAKPKQRPAAVTRNEVSLRHRKYFSILHHSNIRSLLLSPVTAPISAPGFKPPAKRPFLDHPTTLQPTNVRKGRSADLGIKAGI